MYTKGKYLLDKDLDIVSMIQQMRNMQTNEQKLKNKEKIIIDLEEDTNE